MLRLSGLVLNALADQTNDLFAVCQPSSLSHVIESVL